MKMETLLEKVGAVPTLWRRADKKMVELFLWHVGILMAIFVVPGVLYPLVVSWGVGGDLVDNYLHFQQYTTCLLLLVAICSFKKGMGMAVLFVVSMVAFLSPELISMEDVGGGAKLIFFAAFFVIFAVMAAGIMQELKIDSERIIYTVYLHFLTVLSTVCLASISPQAASTCLLVGVWIIGMILLSNNKSV